MKPVTTTLYIPITNIFKKSHRVVLKRLMDHCNGHKPITEDQHGFIKERSTATVT